MTERIDVEDARLWAEVSGEGPPVALIHGFTLDHRMWEPQMAALRDRYRVLWYDERGHGRSSMPGTDPYSHADDLAALMKRLRMARAHVVALSVGVAHALELALEHPACVRSLVLVDASGLDGVPFPPEVADMFVRIRSAVATDGVEAGKRVWLDGGWFAGVRERPGVAAAVEAQLATYTGWHWTQRNPVRVPSPPVIERLAEIQVPTLVLVGERDLPYNHEVAAMLVDGIADAQHGVLPGAGHMANMEAPAAFNAELLRFLDRVEAGGSG